MIWTGITGQRGNVSIVVAFIMVLLFGIAALVVDFGALYVERRNMVTAADAAVLAGARELVLTGDENAALEVARAYAQVNGAEITDAISIETVTHNGESFQAVVAIVGVNRDYYFGRLLGFTDQDVMARAVATWGYPTSCLDLYPFFHQNEDDNLPQGEVSILNPDDEDDFAPGNWGYLRVGSPGGPGKPGTKEIRDVLSGEKESGIYLVVGDDITAFTQTGIPKSVTYHGVEARLENAADPDSGISLVGIIPIIHEMTGQGHTAVEIVGFAPFKILDVVTDPHGTGSIYAHFADVPPARKYDYPHGTIVGEFLEEKFIPSRHYIEITQNPEHDFGIRMVKLIQ